MSHVLVSATHLLRSIENIEAHNKKKIAKGKKRDIAAYYASLRQSWNFWGKLFRRPHPTPKQARDTYSGDWRDGDTGYWKTMMFWKGIHTVGDDTNLNQLKSLALAIHENQRDRKNVTLDHEHAWVMRWKDKNVKQNKKLDVPKGTKSTPT